MMVKVLNCLVQCVNPELLGLCCTSHLRLLQFFFFSSLQRLLSAHAAVHTVGRDACPVHPLGFDAVWKRCRMMWPLFETFPHVQRTMAGMKSPP